MWLTSCWQIGDWSRWLSTLFGIEENDSSGDNEDLLHDKAPSPAKPFNLLNALSDLMMLPFEMLADPQTRKEVSLLCLLALHRLMHFIMLYAKFLSYYAVSRFALHLVQLWSGGYSVVLFLMNSAQFQFPQRSSGHWILRLVACSNLFSLFVWNFPSLRVCKLIFWVL